MPNQNEPSSPPATAAPLTPKIVLGTLLDAWEGINNDFKSQLEDDFPAFYRALQELLRLGESGELWPDSGATAGTAREFLDNYQDAWVLSISENGKSAIAAFAEAYAAERVRQALFNREQECIGLQIEALQEECVEYEKAVAELRQERDALIVAKNAMQLDCQTAQHQADEFHEKWVRAERALREARDKTLDEAIAVAHTFGISRKGFEALSALKSSEGAKG